jgi:hypothetical protein
VGASQRRKGAGWERELAKLFRAIYPGAKRGIGQARSAKEVSDVEGTPYWIEAKCGARTNPRAALRQAQECTDGRPVLVVCKDDHQEPFVVMPLEQFLSIEGNGLIQYMRNMPAHDRQTLGELAQMDRTLGPPTYVPDYEGEET